MYIFIVSQGLFTKPFGTLLMHQGLACVVIVRVPEQFLTTPHPRLPPFAFESALICCEDNGDKLEPGRCVAKEGLGWMNP